MDAHDEMRVANQCDEPRHDDGGLDVLISCLPQSPYREKLGCCIANLREQLAAAEKAANDQSLLAEQYRLDAEAAEAKLKAASEQEPVAWMHATDDYYVICSEYKARMTQGYMEYSRPLYAAPIPPAQAREEGRKEAVPEGWRVVPNEATWVMVQAGRVATDNTVYTDVLDSAYKSMLAASPKPEGAA